MSLPTVAQIADDLRRAERTGGGVAYAAACGHIQGILRGRQGAGRYAGRTDAQLLDAIQDVLTALDEATR